MPSLELVPRVAAGNVPATARLISRIEAGSEEVRAAQSQVYSMAGRAQVIGITGVPGSGKSTMVATLARRFLELDHRVAIIAVDPSSPYSGGAILGDRIRMTELAADSNVFIRSMATRGSVGGLARATLDAVDVLDVAGFDVVMIETVGVGQDEVEIARASHTTIVVSAPGLGDDVQAIKAGMLEIADIHVVSKCDRSDAARTLADIKQMLALGIRAGGESEWRVPLVGVSSVNEQGFDKLIELIASHHKVMGTAAGEKRRQEIAEFRLRKTAETLLLRQFNESADRLSGQYVSRLTQRDSDPYELATQLLTQSIGQET